MTRDVIIALDFDSGCKALDFLNRFTEVKPFVKIGMELFYAEGPEIVRQVKAGGHKVFLDLKLHDIPNTVRSAMSVLLELDADMINVHASGTGDMMRAALEGASRKDGTRPILIAVTQLTSTTQERMREELLIEKSMEDTVCHYAKSAKAAGLDGVVCSPLEVKRVKEVCGQDFMTITPGIRFSGGDTQDQARVTTPSLARELGSDYIVVGRPITQSADPVSAYLRCLKEFCP
jgi:orotidine-5'-phosphate decarboxylase